jgi:hypothetical protein
MRPLEKYEYKNLRTDHITLMPGPPEHVGVVRKIFEWYAWGKTECAHIARRLNDFGLVNGDTLLA